MNLASCQRMSLAVDVVGKISTSPLTAYLPRVSANTVVHGRFHLAFHFIFIMHAHALFRALTIP